ncbi:hypothetical protein BDA96_01G254900 [Sorghum bicolor]|uniref:ENT domain-containing protein n=1 Tax=Sorghum bicolor TaxID=4558 RepID=A0A921S0R4_SORBI|nr:hypothetical protein BDA96_01G254900 [Sorghum bicolor]
MEDSVQVACVIPSAADAAFQIYSLKRSAYAAVLRAFCAQSDILSRDKVRCLTELRNELKILQTEHAECLVKARSNKQIKSFSVGLHSKGNTCSTEVIKDFLGLACVLPDAGDTVFQIHCLERSAYASVLRAFCAVTNHLSLLQVKLLSQLKNELRISHSEHKEVLMKVSLNEHIKSLRKFSLANLSVVTKTNPAFDVHAVLHDKIGPTGQVCTSSTSCLSLIQQSSVSENSMSSTRDIGISDSSNGAEGPYFESHTVVSAKRLKTVNGHAPAYLKCGPSNQLPVAVSAVMVEKHSQLNAGQGPLSVDHTSQESGKRKTVVPEMSVSESLDVMDRKYEIEYQKPKNKDSDLEHGSEIIKLCLTASLLSKVERIFKENPDSANLEKAKLTLKAQEKDLLGALAKLSEVSYDVVYFGANHNHRSVNLNEHGDGKGDEAVLPKLVSSSDETLPGARLGDGGTENKVKIQGIASIIVPLSSDPHQWHCQPIPAPPGPATARGRVFRPWPADGRGADLHALGAVQENQVHGGADGADAGVRGALWVVHPQGWCGSCRCLLHPDQRPSARLQEMVKQQQVPRQDSTLCSAVAPPRSPGHHSAGTDD